MNHVWAIEDETGSKSDSIWKILHHQYRKDGSRRVKINMYSLMSSPMWENQTSGGDRFKNMPFEEFVAFVTRLIPGFDQEYQEKMMKEYVRPLKDLQYGDHLEVERMHPLFLDRYFLGYGPDHTNIDPKKLYLMPICEGDSIGAYHETIPFSFGDADPMYFNCKTDKWIHGFLFMDKNKGYQHFFDEFKKLPSSIQPKLDFRHVFLWRGEKECMDLFNCSYLGDNDKDMVRNHMERLQYAKKCRKERISKLIENTRCFEINGLIAVLVSYLV